MNGQKLYNEIVETVEGGGMVRINGNLVTTVNSTEWSNDPENEVLLLLYGDEGSDELSEHITEDDLDNAVIDNSDIVIKDVPTEHGGVYYDKDIRLSLYRRHEVKV